MIVLIVGCAPAVRRGSTSLKVPRTKVTKQYHRIEFKPLAVTSISEVSISDLGVCVCVFHRVLHFTLQANGPWMCFCLTLRTSCMINQEACFSMLCLLGPSNLMCTSMWSRAILNSTKLFASPACRIAIFSDCSMSPHP